MVKRAAVEKSDSKVLPSPGLRDAQVLDLMCTQFVLTLVERLGGGFNARRDLHGVIELTGRHLVWPLPVLQRLREFLDRRCAGHELWTHHETLSPQDFLTRYGDWRGPYEEGTLFFFLDDYARQQPRDIMLLLSGTAHWLRETLKKQSTLVQKNIDALAGLLQLNQAERALLLYGTLTRYQRELRSLLVEFKVNNAAEAHAVLAEVAGVPASEVAEALRTGSRLERIGLVDNLISEHNVTDLADLMKVSEKLPPVLMREYRDQAELMAVFTRPASKTGLAMEDFTFVEERARLLAGLLRQAVAAREVGVNVLLYGPPGTGKTELAKVAAQAAGLELFEVEYSDRDGNALSGRERYRSLQIAQVFLRGSAQSALLFDEVEDVFPPISSEAAQLLARADKTGPVPTASVSGKAWVNQILESNPVPTIWVTNHIDQIDPAFRRRFTYHLELKSPPPGARDQLVRKALEGVAVTEPFVARLVARKALTPAQIHTAVRFARLVREAGPMGDAPSEEMIEHQLTNADAALGGRLATPAPASSATLYDLDLLHVESRFELPRIAQALQASGHGSLCFYGPPGSGKTALAQYLAAQMGRPLHVRQASDLISKFIGETEQHMAEMFAEAEHENAVLLLDEADSFLQDRRGAQRTYEVTEVNEMLQGMERFRGVFICTTNMMDRIDQAALRRFTFKIRFKPMTIEQRRRMFKAEVLKDQPDELATELQRRLDALDQLCPGDFAAVQRQARILGAAFTAEEFLEQLEAEHRLKPEVRESRAVGFLQ